MLLANNQVDTLRTAVVLKCLDNVPRCFIPLWYKPAFEIMHCWYYDADVLKRQICQGCIGNSATSDLKYLYERNKIAAHEYGRRVGFWPESGKLRAII